MNALGWTVRAKLRCTLRERARARGSQVDHHTSVTTLTTLWQETQGCNRDARVATQGLSDACHLIIVSSEIAKHCENPPAAARECSLVDLCERLHVCAVYM